MLMNRTEYWLMNNPIRSLIQDRYESRLLRRLSGLPPGEDVLEIGCGQGIGRSLIFKHFRPGSYAGVDLDPRMIDRAKRRHPRAAREFAVGDAAALAFADASFGAVFDYGIIHHVLGWRDVLAEVYRVLRPGGEFVFEEVSRETWGEGTGWPLKRLLRHPYDRMFSADEFHRAIRDTGFSVASFERRTAMGLRFFCGVARKAGAVQSMDHAPAGGSSPRT